MKRQDKVLEGYENDDRELKECLNSFELGEKIQKNGCVYRFIDCEGKDKKSQYDYDKGCFGIIYDSTYQSVTTFFKKKINKNALKELNIQSTLQGCVYDIFGIKSTDGKLRITRRDKQWFQIKFENKQNDKWKELIDLLRKEPPESKKTEKPRQQTKSIRDKNLSTQGSHNEQISLNRLKSEESSGKKHKGRCYLCGRDDRQDRQNKRIRELQEQLNAQKKTKQICVQKMQEMRVSSGSFESYLERELLEKIEKLQTKLKDQETKLKDIIMYQNIESTSCTQLQGQNIQLKQKNLDYEKRNKQLSEQLKVIHNQLDKYKQKQQEKNKQLQKSKKQVQKHIKTIQQLNQQIHIVNQRASQASKVANMYQSQVEKLRKDNQLLVLTYDTSSRAVRQPQFQASEYKKIKEQMKKMQGQIDDHKKIEKSLRESYEKKLAQKLKLLRQMEEKVKQISGKYEQSIKQRKIIKASLEQRDKLCKTLMLNSVFNGQLLKNLMGYKQFLIRELQSYMNRKIINTNQVYKFDAYNKVNFHSYIDNLSNLVIIVRTSSGFLLAGFTQSAFYPKVNAGDTGLLLSLTNCQTFRCQQGKKSITYDQYYIIFGNSQLRIKSLQNRIFSNFGIANGFYNSKGAKVDALLGENNREIDIDAYQIYQVLFE